jgi:hypothetical protein
MWQRLGQPGVDDKDDGPIADYVFISLELFFSDGSTHQFRLASEVK